MVPRRPLIVAGLAAGLFALLMFLVAVRAAAVVRFDALVSSAAWRFALAHPVWRTTALAVTTIGGPAVVTVAGVLAGVVLVVAGRRRGAAFVLVAMAGTTVVRRVVLAVVARARPVDRLAGSAGWSFPSGHATGSAAAALTALALLWPLLRGKRRIAVVAVVVAWAGAVGASRVALVVHWPTDVLGGWLLATAIVTAATPILRQRPVHDDPVGQERVRSAAPRGRRARLRRWLPPRHRTATAGRRRGRA